MPRRLPGSREEDSWLSERQLAGLARADEADAMRSPIPTQVVSNGEYLPFPQTLQQRQVEARIAELAGYASRKLGTSRRRFLASAGGMAAAFLAMNEVFGRFFEVSPLEMFGPAYAADGVPRDLFVFDDQLHMIRQSFNGPLALRAMSQGAGAAASAAGFDKNPFNTEGLPDELGRPWAAWNPSLGQTPITGANFHLVKFIKDIYLDSQVAVAILSNAPLGLFEPAGGGKPRTPRSVDESLAAMNLTGFQTAAVRDFVNNLAGSTRLLAHGQIFPGRENLGFMQQQIDQFHPDSWKGYNIAYTAKLDGNPESELRQWRLDDEKVAYPTYELIRNNRKELESHPGFFNICIHKGLAPAAPDTPEQGSPTDLPKAARDWPEFNFIIYHSCFGPRFFDAEALQAIRSEKLRNGVPDLRWLTEFAQLSAPLPNVYAEIGTTFASCVVTFPTVCAHMLGQLMKYMGPRRIVFGSDSLWYGAPQWQIEAFWRFQIPESMAKKYGYPQLTAEDKRRILGLNSAGLYKLPTSVATYKPLPKDYEGRIPDGLKATLNYPGYSKPGSDRGALEERYTVPNDRLAELRADYLTAGGHPSNRRYGWIQR
ncbi:MAG TPA: amidohydrolase family protein [Burkholderiales bacterium]|nr:amidohydrolase family protein [Burkholderiales bacterium]